MELRFRKPTRLKDYDYSQNGAYFVTICTKDKKCILSQIVGDGLPDVPKNILTKYGKIADKYINQLGNFYQNISVDKYVVMPNHIHIILTITDNSDVSCGTSGRPSPTNSVLSRFVSTFKRFCNNECGEKLWQRSFHDHIIRGEEDYRKIWEYVDTNVIKWESDCFFM